MNKLTDALGWMLCEASFRLWDWAGDDWIENGAVDRLAKALNRVGTYFYDLQPE